MPTYTLTTDANSHPSKTNPYVQEVREKIFDASKRNLVQNDIVELIAVKKGETVRRVDVEILTVDANPGTSEIGDGADPNGYVEAFNDALLAYIVGGPVFTEAAPPTFNGYTRSGKHYTADDTIDLRALGPSGLTTGKYLVRAFVEFKAADGVT